MPVVNIAGELPEDEYLKAALTIKKGIRLDNPRGGERREFTFKVSDGFLMLKARVQTLANPLPDDFQIFYKKSKNATQAQFVELNNENFVDNLKARWSKITQLDMTRWATSNTTAVEGTIFEVFVYKARARRQPAQQMRRATANAIQRAGARLDAHAQNNNLQIGQIERQHLAVHNARHAAAQDGDQVLIPNDATTRQARALDRAQAELDAQDQATAEQLNNFMRPIQFELNGTMNTVRVDIRTLRTALGLPQHDLFHQGIYNGYEHPDLPAGADMDDVDHQEEEAPE